MTFAGFDAAPLIESGGFTPLIAGEPMILIAAGDGTLEAALREAGLGGPRAAPDPHDLWADPADSHAARVAAQAALAGASWRGWALLDGDGAADAPGKPLVLRAAYDDVDGDGQEDPPIIVTANTINEGTGDENGGGYDGGFYPGLPGYGGIGDGMASYLDSLDNQCAADNKVDYAAQQIANLIKTMPDWNEREYAAIIYMTPDGMIRMTSLFRGQTVAEAQAAGQIAPETHLTTPSDLGGGVILAVIHSHPDVGYDILGDLENLYPSDRVGSGDYHSFEQLAGHDPRFANNAAFAQYILGPDGQLREFNAKNGRINTFNDPDPESRTNLAKDRPCG